MRKCFFFFCRKSLPFENFPFPRLFFQKKKQRIIQQIKIPFCLLENHYHSKKFYFFSNIFTEKKHRIIQQIKIPLSLFQKSLLFNKILLSHDNFLQKNAQQTHLRFKNTLQSSGKSLPFVKLSLFLDYFFRKRNTASFNI